jgi:hypothetical protein
MAKKWSQEDCDVRRYVANMTRPMTVREISEYSGVPQPLETILNRLIDEGSLKPEDNPNDSQSPLYLRIKDVDLSGC